MRQHGGTALPVSAQKPVLSQLADATVLVADAATLTADDVRTIKAGRPGLRVLAASLAGDRAEALAATSRADAPVDGYLLLPARRQSLVGVLLNDAKFLGREGASDYGHSGSQNPGLSPSASSGEDQLPVPGRRVLLAEDNDVNALLTVSVLERDGHEVIRVVNGREAVEALNTQARFDIVLMDMHMPEMDGVEATEALRNDGHSVHVVALTANAYSEDRQRCLDAGMDDYLSKPVEPEALRNILSNLEPARDNRKPGLSEAV